MAGRSTTGSDPGAAKLTTGLGWFSLGLGATQLLAPGRVNRMIGVRDDTRTRFGQVLVGAQELTAAAGILSQRRPVMWLWGRTAGDALHIAMVARAAPSRAERPARVAMTLGALAGCFITDAYASARMSSQPHKTGKARSMKATAAITVLAPRETAQRSWQEFERQADGGARLGPLESSEEAAGSLRWRTTSGAPATASGVARFLDAPGGRGTEIYLELEYEALAGAAGAVVQKVTGDDPGQAAQDDLRRFKQLVETGEIARSDGAPAGHSAKLQPKQRPAQPVEHTRA